MFIEAKFPLKFHPVFDFPKRWLFLYSTKRLEYVETLLIECIPNTKPHRSKRMTFIFKRAWPSRSARLAKIKSKLRHKNRERKKTAQVLVQLGVSYL